MIVDHVHGIRTRDQHYNFNVAASSNSPPRALPAFGNRAGLLRALEAIGVTNLSRIAALAAAGKPLGSDGDRLDVYELDMALKKFQLDVSRRMYLKTALRSEGLL